MAPKRSVRARLLPGLAKLARHVPPSLALAARPAIAALLAAAPGLRTRLRGTMTAVLGPEPPGQDRAREYFRRLADLVAFSMVVYRSGMGAPALEREWYHDPDSRRLYVEALGLGKGVLLVAPHLTGMEFMVGTAAREFSIAVLARKAPEPAYEALKQEWYEKLGVQVVHRPPRGARHGDLAEATAALRVLRRNGTLAITPDLLQRPGSGIPVRLFGKTAELPAGAFFLSMRTGAPIMPSFFHREGGRYRLWTHEPFQVDAGSDRDAAMAAGAQRWADMFEAFVREHPDMWQFWLDKRWSQWLLDDAGGGMRVTER